MTIIFTTSLSHGQLRPEIAIENGILTINDYQLDSEISTEKLDELLKEAGKIVRHKRKKFKDRHHGTRHVIPEYVEVIYHKSGLVFKGSDKNKLTQLQINLRSKESTESYILSVLDKEFELNKNNPGFNLSKSQHQKAYMDIYMDTFDPWTDHQFSGKLRIENQIIISDSSIFDLTEENLNLFEDAFFNKNALNQKFNCMTPASAMVVGFCECVTYKLKLILFDEDMKLQTINYIFGRE